jgi:hypothetical protein
MVPVGMAALVESFGTLPAQSPNPCPSFSMTVPISRDGRSASVTGRLYLFLCAVAALGACDSGSSEAGLIVASQLIGPTGGEIVVTEGDFTGTRLIVPAGAVTEPTQITLLRDLSFSVPGYFTASGTVVVGEEPSLFAVRIEPRDLSLSQPAMLQMRQVAGVEGSGSVSGEGVVLLERTARFEALARTTTSSSDPDFPMDFVLFRSPIEGGGQFQLAEQIEQPDSPPVFFTPNNTWELDTGMTIRTETVPGSEPNFALLGGSTLRVIFEMPAPGGGTADFLGLYIRSTFGQPLLLVGAFDDRMDRPGFQQILDAPLEWFPASVLNGQPVRAFFEFDQFAPFGSETAEAEGVRGRTDYLIERQAGALSIPAGDFDFPQRIDVLLDFDGAVTETVWFNSIESGLPFAVVDLFGLRHSVVTANVNFSMFPM